MHVHNAMQPKQPTKSTKKGHPRPSPQKKSLKGFSDTPPSSDAGAYPTSYESAQSDIAKQFTSEFNAGCAKQSRRDAVLLDIIERIAAGEKAMIVFCEEKQVRKFSAFKLGARAGKLCVEEYD